MFREKICSTFDDLFFMTSNEATFCLLTMGVIFKIVTFLFSLNLNRDLLTHSHKKKQQNFAADSPEIFVLKIANLNTLADFVLRDQK